MSLLNYKFRLYPTPEQELVLEQTLDGCRWVYTSINCSQCGHPVPKSLAVRTHVCPECETVLDRDHNSSLNIKRNGLELLGLLPVERREVTPVEIAARSRKQEEAHALRHG